MAETIFEIVFFTLIAVLVYGYTWAMYFSTGNGAIPEGQFARSGMPRWLKVGAVVFTPVTLAVFCVMYGALIVGLFGAFGWYILKGDAWRDFRFSHKANTAWNSLSSSQRQSYHFDYHAFKKQYIEQCRV